MGAHSSPSSVSPTTAKAAELASGLGAVVLGAGLALLAPELLHSFAVPVLVTGIVVHGTGMTLKRRLERSGREPLWWEATLFWLCWVCLAVLAVWLALRLLAH
jgi:hypothetical protein